MGAKQAGGASQAGSAPPRLDPEMLLERASEISALEAAIERAARGAGSSVLISGPAGIGKTSLADLSRSRALDAGLTVLHARGGDLERELPWAAVRELFAPALADAEIQREADSLLAGSARVAQSIVEGPPAGQAEPAPGGDPLAAATHGLYWLASNLAERRPLMLVVDDVHQADRPSLQYLGYLAQRVDDLAVLVLATARSPEPGADRRLPQTLADADLVLQPDPLSEQGAGRLLARQAGSEPEPEFAAGCHQLTAGNPHLLAELALELRREGIAPTAANVERLRGLTPGGISRAALLRLARFPEPVKRMAEAVAVLGAEARLANAAGLAGLGEDEAAEIAAELSAADVLADSLPLSYAHPIIRSVVYDEIPAPRRSRLHVRAADLLAEHGADAGLIAVQLLRTEPVGRVDVVEVLRQGARESLASGAPESAIELLERALREPPPTGERADVLLELAEAEAAIGSAQALERLEAALEIVEDPRARAEIHYRLGWLLFNAGGPGAASDVFDRGLEALGDADSELASILRTATVGTAAVVGKMSVEELEEVLYENRATPTTRAAEREVLTQLAVARVFSSSDCEQARSLAERALGDGEMLRESGLSLSFSIAASCLIWADALDAVEREIELALDMLQQQGDALGTAYVRFGRSWVCYWRGRVGEAAADAATAGRAWSGGGRLSGQLPLARYWQAISLIELDELEEAARALGEEEAGWDPHYQLSWRLGAAKLALATGDPATAREQLRVLTDPTGPPVPFFHSPATYCWRSDAALAAFRLGESDDAERLVAEELSLARGFGSPRAIGIALRTQGLIAGGEPGIDLLAESVATLESSPSRLELCRSLVELGAAVRRSGSPAKAREPLARGLELAHEVGATALERRAREELVAAGARPRRAMLSGPESLTASERRVADLAGSGLTNREIGEQLFVSLRTVETHLTHAYSKLDVSSRRQLVGALRDTTQSGSPAEPARRANQRSTK